MSLNIRACRICGASQTRIVLRSLRGSRFQILACGRCGVEFQHPQPNAQEIQEIYTAGYYKAWNMDTGELSSVAGMKKLTFARTLREIQRHMPGGKMLDVGTATGFFLEVAQSQGFEPYGVEISEYAGQIAATKFPPGHIHIGTLETAPFPDAMFSVIAMSDLLEHVTDPVRTLHVAHRMLAHDGVLAITTPNTASLSRRLMGSRWTHYKLEHLFYWSPASIRVVAGMAGFEVIAVEPARKTVTPEYVRAQMDTYPHWFLTPVAELAKAALGPLASRPVTFKMGDMLAILRKRS